MKKLFILLCSAAAVLTVYAAEKPFSPGIVWSGYKGKAVATPSVSSVKGPDGKSAVRIEAQSDSKYQGALGTFEPLVDFSKYSAVEFYIRHNIHTRKGGCSMVFMAKGPQGNIHCQFVTPSPNWSKVSIPLDRSSFSAQRGNSVNLTMMETMRIYPFANMDKKGKFLEIADFKLIPKTTSTQKIKVMSYKHTAVPTSGEKGNTLTDGDKTKNVFFRQFSDDPFITFDLGGRFTIDELKVTANCAPSHNFAEIAIFTSFDNKEFVPAGNLRNNADGTAVKQITYTFKSTEKPIVGRYVRLKATRPRSDFPVELAEVEFFGHTPTEAEIVKASEINYDTGVKMPARNDKDYVVYTAGDYKLYISRTNGVVNGLYYKGKLIVERMTPAYTLQTRAADTPADGNLDKVIDIKAADGKVYVTTVNKALPDLEFKRTWYVVKNALFERVEIINKGMKERKFLRIATGVILEQKFRSQGFYEMPGTALAVGMFRLPSSEIQMDRSLTNIPTIGFENASTRQVIWHTRFKFNDRFTYMDVGTEEENLQIFRPNGWLITAATIVPLDRKVHSFENRFSVTEGGMLKAFDEYISTPEAAAYRGQVKRPAWLRDLRCIVSQGWDGSYPGSHKRHFDNMNRSFSHRGYLSDPAWFDMDGIWGDLYIKGETIGWFGNRHPVEELRAKLANTRKTNPNLKLGFYTWFWSAFPWSTPVKNHPEWFVTRLRSGAPASWFPGVNVNYLRFFGIKESRDEATKQIVDFVNYYQQDNWYLDGGKSGTYAKCYDTMRIDDPLGQTDFYLDVRNGIQKNNPDRIVFFNHSENPLGDIGYLESFGGTLTNEWRRGAILMWKFKMYAYKDPLHHSVYIYWLPGVDGAFHNYMTGIGVVGAYGSRHFNTRDLPFIGARYEIRQAQLTDAEVKPDWRMDAKEDVECMTLQQGNNGWIFINPHGGKAVTREISALTAPMNIKDASKPIYAWLYTIKDGKNYKAQFSERTIRDDYKKYGWIAERAVVPQYLGKFPYTERFSTKVDLKDRAKVLMLTQVPAVVLSIEHEPSHYYLAGQPGIELNGDNGKFTVNSEYETAEIGLMLEKDQIPAEVKVNGKTVKAAMRVENNMRFAVVTVDKGKSDIVMTTAKAPAPVQVKKLIVKRYKRKLSVTVVPENALVEVYCEGNLVKCHEGSFRFDNAPDSVRDGVYTFKAGDKVQTLTIKKMGKPTKIAPVLITLKDIPEVKSVDKVVNNIKVTQVGTLYSQGATHAAVDENKLKLSVGVNRIYESHFNRMSAMAEIQAKRYIKVRMDNGFWFFNVYGYQPKKHSVRGSRPNVFGGLIFDFATPQGYTVRSAAGLGIQNEKRATVRPANWGKKGKHDHIYFLDNILVSDKVKEKTCWIDLKSLGAPDDWNGKVIVSIFMEDINPDRKFAMEILETADTLPAGANVLKPLELGAVKTAVLNIKKVSGKVNWKKIPALGEMVPTKSTMEPLKTVVKAAWDDKNLYLYYDAQEVKGRILNCEGGKTGKPWWGDGIEFFVQRSDGDNRIYHALVDVGNVSYCEDTSFAKSAGDKEVIHPKAGFTCKYDIKADRWTAEVVLPWKTIGGKPAAGKLVAFNMMRNRLEQGKSGHYTLAPGIRYFSGKQYQLKLVD